MNSPAYFLMALGTILMAVGILIFIKKGAEGHNVLKMIGFEFQLSGSALVIFVIGAVILLIPFLHPDIFHNNNHIDTKCQELRQHLEMRHGDDAKLMTEIKELQAQVKQGNQNAQPTLQNRMEEHSKLLQDIGNIEAQLKNSKCPGR